MEFLANHQVNAAPSGGLNYISSPSYPIIELKNLSTHEKLFKVAKFLPVAFQAIADRRIHPRYTVHFLDGRDKIIGITAGDVSYFFSK
jgi:hypothetical protein